MSDPVLTFRPDGLGRPPVDVLNAIIDAAWELQFTPRDQRLRGVLRTGQWLGQVWNYGPVSGEDRAPGPQAVRDEYDAALAVIYGLPTAPRDMQPQFAQGVVDMLVFALGRGEAPVTVTHTEAPPSAAA
jgi:hypothetical protein